FLGVLEKPFSEFCWEDLASVDDMEVFAIPRHRIQYFKYRGEKVWDKASRLDLVFGSSGADQSGGGGVHAFMAEIDDKRDAEVQEEEDLTSDEDSDLDSDDDSPSLFVIWATE
ncbi:Leukocyte receptor cluster member 9, partial [Caligus rogercresseyi]